MQDLRTKRIRAGVIVIVVSVIVMGVLASLTSPRAYGDWLERSIRLWKTGTKPEPSGGLFRAARERAHQDWAADPYWYAYLKVKHILALGLIGVGVGAVLVVVGLTTPRERKVGVTLTDIEARSKGVENG